QAADGNQMDFGGTELLFSPALPHGYDDQLGYVVMTRIAQGDEVFVHTADVLGPPLKEHLSFLIDAQPTVLYVDGPMTHMPDNYPEEHTKRSLSHLQRILRTTNVRTLILDHHILRDRGWRARMEPVFQAGKEHDVAVLTAAQPRNTSIASSGSRGFAAIIAAGANGGSKVPARWDIATEKRSTMVSRAIGPAARRDAAASMWIPSL